MIRTLMPEVMAMKVPGSGRADLSFVTKFALRPMVKYDLSTTVTG